jgi:cobaltochelatase CobS
MKTLPVDELFGLRKTQAIKNAKGDTIQVEVLEDRTDDTKKFLPIQDDTYVFPAEETIDLTIALDSRGKDNILIHGLHGSGKSSIAEQVCFKMNRPCARYQHSVDTEASDIVGQWVLEGDKTSFHYGPLARAMRDGLVYIADEYDFALPNVLAVYQAVLEGAPLIIKQAPEHMAVVKPHKDFRFIATGNTNGSGDETGLYQGTQIQNAANYSRFGMTIKMDYQSATNEKQIIKRKIGELPEQDLDKLMEFSSSVRKAYENKTITNTVSTREILAISKWAVLRGRDTGPNWTYGINRAFANRMSTIDAAAIREHAQRIFG